MTSGDVIGEQVKFEIPASFGFTFIYHIQDIAENLSHIWSVIYSYDMGFARVTLSLQDAIIDNSQSK